MASRRPLVIVSGQFSELPAGDTVLGTSAGTLAAGSGLSGGGALTGSTVTLDVSLATNASGLIFVGDALGIDGVVQTVASAAQASGNAALVVGTTALASGNAALIVGSTAQASGNAGIASAILKLPLSGGTLTGDITLNAQSDVRFADNDSSNYVGFQAASVIAADVLWTLPATDGTNGQVISTNGSGTLSWATALSVVNYPQNIQSAAYTLVIGDAGKQIFHPVSDTTSRTFTIPANSSVAFPIGTVILFTNENGAGPLRVAITTDTLVNGNGLTGTINVPSNNTLECIKVTATKWMATLFVQNIAPSEIIAVAHNSSPFVSVYPFSSSGFGTKFSDPATLPAGNGFGVAVTQNGDAIAVAHTTSPFISAYPFSANGFGTKFSNPATLPASNGTGVAFSPAGDAIAVGYGNTSPFASVYSFSSSGFGTKFSDPATLPLGGGFTAAFSPTGNALAISHGSSPYLSVYPWSASGFGTKFSDPATLPTGFARQVTFNLAGTAIAVAHNTSPRVSVYPWSASGFGTKFSNPATLPASDGAGVAFSPAGDAIAVGNASVSPFISAYPFSASGFGAKFVNPATLPTGTNFSIAFNLAGTAIAVAHDTSPFLSVYPWSASGFGTKFSNPATLPTGQGNSVAFSTL